jgi:hypothetical protein
MLLPGADVAAAAILTVVGVVAGREPVQVPRRVLELAAQDAKPPPA